MKLELARTISAVIAMFALSSEVRAKELAIICTFEGSYDKNGYETLVPSDFSVLITENLNGNATGASVSDTPLCAYTNIETYNDELIHFSGCARPSWLAAGRTTPEGYLKINRYSGGFEQYTKFPESEDWLMHVGTCRAESKRF